MERFALYVFFLLTFIQSGSTFFSRHGDGPEDVIGAIIMDTLGPMLDDVIRESTHTLSPWQQYDVLDGIVTDLDLVRNASKGCKECVVVTGALIRLIQNQDLTFEDLRDQAINICYNVTANDGWDGDLICEGIIDIYGPHVVYIANNTNMTSEEACITLMECDPEDIEPGSWVTQTKVNVPIISQGQTKAKGEGRTRNTRPSAADYEGAIRVVHITDLHNEPYYDVGSDNVCDMPMCCHDEWPGSGYAGPWGAYYCNLPTQTTDLYLDFLSDLQPDMLMYTGDSPPNTVWQETLEFQIDMSRLIANKIQTRLPGVPAYSTLGNHECYPTNLYYTPREDTQALNREFGLMWQEMSSFSQEQLDTMNIGGYYSVLVKPGLRVLSYNTNFVATSNWYLLLDMMSNGYGEMMQFMEDTFDNARANNEKVIVLGHHLSGTGSRVREWSEFITDLCKRNADLIVLHLFGHTHKDTWKVNTDPVTGEAYDVQISSASMSCSPEMNPNARIFYLDNTTYTVLDMDTYFLDLQDPVNNGSSPEIRLQYRATLEYDMPDCSPQSFKNLVDRMAVNDTLFAMYRANYATQTGFEGECDTSCQQENICEMKSTSYSQVQQCKAQIP